MIEPTNGRTETPKYYSMNNNKPKLIIYHVENSFWYTTKKESQSETLLSHLLQGESSYGTPQHDLVVILAQSHGWEVELRILKNNEKDQSPS
jgi:hypothetical protein